MRVVVALVLVMLAGPAWAQGQLTQREMIAAVIDNYIRPNFREFAEKGAVLQEKAEALCAGPSEAALEAERAAFREFLLAYARVEFVTTGPLGVGDRVQRLLLWPDPKGIALRQVQTTLAKKDETATDVEALKEKSVGLQGLAALEFVLFGTGAEELAGSEGDYRCRFGLAVARLVTGLAKTIDDEWRQEGEQGAAGQMTDPKPDAENYRTLTEVMEKLAATLLHGTDAIRDQRLMPVLGGLPGERPKPKAALFWRSGMAIKMLEAEFAGLGDFFKGARLREGLAAKDKWIADGAEFEFQSAAETVETMPKGLEEAIADPKGLEAMRHLLVVTGSLDQLLGDNLSRAFGLAIGFSALDGD